ncbi:hypothetical protein LK09_15660 [Microbacterium mangrovi]|uniref:Uncharacterized protein n=1 Tax=Microbacterium mangrovi TaxID=1348253 RepID=A0A0B1ZYV8_9MICO|nr:hypothetical protein LK09_15660 [Microbacterium mangrovi]
MRALSIASYDSIADLPPGVVPAGLALGVLLIALHVWLSRCNPVWLGAIVPIIVIALVTALAMEVRPTVGLIAGYVATIVALIVIWWAGEDTRRMKRERDTAP